MTSAQQLRQEIAALEHELRRVRDGLERNPTHALEQRARQLRDNIALCERDLQRDSAGAKARSDDE
jgi:predicted phage gp36 major capsid-like protein